MDADIIFDIIELAVDLIFALADNTNRSYKSEPSHFTNQNKPYNPLSKDDYQDSVRMHPELYVPPKKKVVHKTEIEPKSPNKIVQEPAKKTANIVEEETTMAEPVITKKTPTKSSTMSLYDTLAHKIEVEVFMIVYMLQQDDGRITREEARVIKRHVRKHKVSLNDGEFQRIKELITEDLSIDTLVERIEQYQVSQKDIRKMFKRLYDVNKVTKRHDRIITFMRNHLAIQLDLDLSGIE